MPSKSFFQLLLPVLHSSFPFLANTQNGRKELGLNGRSVGRGRTAPESRSPRRDDGEERGRNKQKQIHPMALSIASVLKEKAQFLSKEETNSMNDMSAIIVLDGIAVVDEVKAKKLTLFLLKKIQPFGAVVRNDIFIPMDPATNMSLG